MGWSVPPNYAAVERIKQAGLNERHRSIAEEIGLQIVNATLSLGGAYAQDHITGGPQKREILAHEALAKQTTARAAERTAKAKEREVKTGADLYTFAQGQMTDPETKRALPGYDLEAGGARFSTPDAAPPPSMKGRVFDKTLVNPDGSLGGDRGDGTRALTLEEQKAINKSKLARRGSTGPSAADINAADLAKANATIKRIRAEMNSPSMIEGTPKWTEANGRLKKAYERRASIKNKQSDLTVPGRDVPGGRVAPAAEPPEPPATLRDNLKVRFPPRVYDKYRASDQAQLSNALEISTANAKQQFINAKQKMITLKEGTISADQFLTALAKMQNPALNENLTTLAAEAAAGNKDAQIIWDTLAAALGG